ncbi:hypothetical protein QBC42DRAFT_261007 [Cladorrhinum samala]|uniref:DnaJ-like protein C11 C-terminal domain-containing protein n=1 Tax=Cladorrhinum samala TaxID=585594 RepID=A0AAV9I173_9PEZI|nr:hypothetical protein QBC42DRAFT_261007 [Cladorrhinum samala]
MSSAPRPSRRVPSGAAPAAASSSAFDDSASAARSRANHSSRVRPAPSRFSLNDQFATTRKEYEFGFDDASTVASGSVKGVDLDDAVVVGRELTPAGSAVGPVNRDYYELLCLERGANLTPEQVEAASRRLSHVLAVDGQSPRLQGQAGFYLGQVHAAAEALSNSSRRLGYDLSGPHEADDDSDEVTIHELIANPAEDEVSYKARLEEQYLLLAQEEAKPQSGLGVLVDASSIFDPRQDSGHHGSGLEAMDFAIMRSHSTAIPAARERVQHAAQSVYDFFNDENGKGESGQVVRVSNPKVTVKGTAHGLLDNAFKLAPVLLDRYQVPGPSYHSKSHIDQLLESRFLPAVEVNLRQEVSWREQHSSHHHPQADLILEQELALLPHLSTTTRVGHSVHLSDDKNDEPLNIEFSVRNRLGSHGGHGDHGGHDGHGGSSDKIPRLGVALHQKVGENTAFLIADAGNWKIWPKDAASSEKSSGIPLTNGFHHPPTVEVGYSFGRNDELGMQHGHALTKHHERGLIALDSDIDKAESNSSWTISAGLTPGNAATYLRYGFDLFTSYLPGTRNKTKSSRIGGLRAEIELAGTAQKDFYLAFRALKAIGRFSKAGLEVGLSPANLYLSFYWSRLGQRISLPFLMAGGQRSKSLGMKLLFWSTVFPFAAFAAWEMYTQKRKKDKLLAQSLASAARQRELIQEYVAKTRVEADEVTAVLATGVEPRQDEERQKGGLVILSAKYGVRDAPPDEVADVTIAVAALVDGGKLVIPKGLRKGKLLGFWDPAPTSPKVLRVRYLWQGKEGVVEVSGKEPLRLP